MERLAVAAASAWVLVLAACTAQQAAPPPTQAVAPKLSGTIGERTETITATVKTIDLKNRLITLKPPHGKSLTVEVDERVTNLSQVKKGDEVVATYYESMAYEVKNPGEAKPGVTVARTAAADQQGEQAVGFGARTATVTSTIAAIDRAAPSLTLKSPNGELMTVKVRYPERLDHVQVGDLVEITYTRALAISVDAVRK